MRWIKIRRQVLPILIAILAALSPGLDGLARAGDANQPDLRFELSTFDFGAAGVKRQVRHSFPFVNAGTGPLVIKALKPVCGCTAKVSPDGEIPRGKGGQIDVAFETTVRTGRYVATVQVESNDPNRPEIELKVEGLVRSDFAVVPAALDFGDMKQGTEAVRTIRLYDLGDRPFRLGRVTTPEEYLVASVARSNEGLYRVFLIEVILRPDAAVGRFAVPMTLHTNLAGKPRIDVPVTGVVTDPCVAAVVGTKPPQDPRTRGPGRTPYVTRIPTEEDTYVSAWLIKRFLEPGAEFRFVAVDAELPEGAGTIFDLPSPRARWMRSNRGCTSEQILADMNGVDATVKTMVTYVRQLEMASWLVSANSDTGRLRVWIRNLNAGQPDPDTRLARACEFLDQIHKTGGRVP